jgi:hypothetical protein
MRAHGRKQSSFVAGADSRAHADFVSAVNIREAGLDSLACRSSSREVSPSWQEPTEGIPASAWNQ